MPSATLRPLAVAVAGLACVLTSLGCAGLAKKPEVTFDSARFAAADFEAVRVDLVFRVHNPNGFGAKIAGYSLTLVVDEVTLLDGSVDAPLDLSAGATAELVLPATVRWEELAARIGRGGGVPAELPYQAAGDIRASTAFGAVTVPFATEGAIPVVLPPVIRPTDVRVVDSSWTEATVEVDLTIDNPSGQPITVERLDGDLTVADRVVADLAAPSPIEVPAGGSAVHPIRATLTVKELGIGLFRTLTGGGDLEAGARGDAAIGTAVGTIPFAFERSTSGND